MKLEKLKYTEKILIKHFKLILLIKKLIKYLVDYSGMK